MRRLLIALVAALCATLALAACGSSDGGGLAGKDAAGVLKETFGPDHPLKSGRLNLAVAFDSKGLQGVDGPVTAKLSGPFQSLGGKTLPAFALNLTVNAGGQALQAGAVSTGKKGYLNLGGQAFDVGDELFKSFSSGYTKASVDAKKDKTPTFSSLGIKPLGWLRDARKVGEEDVGGARSVHVTAQIDVPKFLDDVNVLLGKAQKSGAAAQAGAPLPGQITAAQRLVITQAIKTASFDVWAGKDDGTLRRIRVGVAFDVPSIARSQVGGLSSGTLALDLVIGALNDKQTITAPTGARPLSDLTGGAATTGTATPPPSSGSASGAGAATDSKYFRCLQAAGEDLAKVQACAKLVGQ